MNLKTFKSTVKFASTLTYAQLVELIRQMIEAQTLAQMDKACKKILKDLENEKD